jgi:hypothetical protein
MELYKRVQDSYDYLILDYNISKDKRKLGQIDLAGVKGEKTDLYEVKCSFRKHKAFKQLVRARRLMASKGSLYFYCGANGQIMEVEE